MAFAGSAQSQGMRQQSVYSAWWCLGRIWRDGKDDDDGGYVGCERMIILGPQRATAIRKRGMTKVCRGSGSATTFVNW